MKNNKQIIIDAPEGKVIDMEHLIKTNEVIFIDEKPTKIEFPKKWELENKTYFYINDDSGISKFDSDGTVSPCTLRNSLPTKSLAEQMLIFTQLITMRERYREIEKHNNPELGEIDWGNIQQNKYSIAFNHNELQKDVYLYLHNTFSFQLKETCDVFDKNFCDMILQCKDILG